MQAAYFAIHIGNMILFPFSVLLKNLQILLKALQVLDLNIGLLEILDIPPKCLYLGDTFKINAGALKMQTADTSTVSVCCRWKQWLCSKCWYPEDRGSKFFQNAIALMMQIEDSPKLLVP